MQHIYGSTMWERKLKGRMVEKHYSIIIIIIKLYVAVGSTIWSKVRSQTKSSFYFLVWRNFVVGKLAGQWPNECYFWLMSVWFDDVFSIMMKGRGPKDILFIMENAVDLYWSCHRSDNILLIISMWLIMLITQKIKNFLHLLFYIINIWIIFTYNELLVGS